MSDQYTTYQSPFSWRYASPEMRALWSELARRKLWRRIWVALAAAEAEAGLVSAEQVAELEAHAAGGGIGAQVHGEIGRGRGFGNVHVVERNEASHAMRLEHLCRVGELGAFSNSRGATEQHRRSVRQDPVGDLLAGTGGPWHVLRRTGANRSVRHEHRAVLQGMTVKGDARFLERQRRDSFLRLADNFGRRS